MLKGRKHNLNSQQHTPAVNEALSQHNDVEDAPAKEARSTRKDVSFQKDIITPVGENIDHNSVLVLWASYLLFA